MTDDYGLALAVDTVAAALAAELGGTAPGRSYEPGADLNSAPAVGIEPSAPWAEFRTIGGRCLEVAWRMRVLLGRWESAASLNLALRTYRRAAPQLRRSGFGVASLDAPTVATVAGQPHLLATFTVAATSKE